MFWDSSALIPLAFTERSSADMVTLAGETRALVVWWGTSVECAAAAYRRHRQTRGIPSDLRAALQQVHDILADARVVPAVEAIRIRAERLVGSYPLRAADALQLAAALTWCEEQPWNQPFVCLDKRLRDAARQEGFSVLPEALE